MLSRISLRYFSSKGVITRISPAVQFYLRSYLVDITKLTPTGVKGMVTKADVLKYIKEKQLKPIEYFSQPKVSTDTKVKAAVQSTPKINVSKLYIWR